MEAVLEVGAARGALHRLPLDAPAAVAAPLEVEIAVAALGALVADEPRLPRRGNRVATEALASAPIADAEAAQRGARVLRVDGTRGLGGGTGAALAAKRAACLRARKKRPSPEHPFFPAEARPPSHLLRVQRQGGPQVALAAAKAVEVERAMPKATVTEAVVGALRVGRWGGVGG